MTTERFKQINLPADIIDIKTSKIYHTTTGNDGYELCILLNELHEENEQLRHDATILIQSNQDYRKKNEELKQQLRHCEKFRHTVYQEISKEMSKHD